MDRLNNSVTLCSVSTLTIYISQHYISTLFLRSLSHLYSVLFVYFTSYLSIFTYTHTLVYTSPSIKLHQHYYTTLLYITLLTPLNPTGQPYFLHFPCTPHEYTPSTTLYHYHSSLQYTSHLSMHFSPLLTLPYTFLHFTLPHSL